MLREYVLIDEKLDENSLVIEYTSYFDELNLHVISKAIKQQETNKIVLFTITALADERDSQKEEIMRVFNSFRLH